MTVLCSTYNRRPAVAIFPTVLLMQAVGGSTEARSQVALLLWQQLQAQLMRSRCSHMTWDPCSFAADRKWVGEGGTIRCANLYIGITKDGATAMSDPINEGAGGLSRGLARKVTWTRCVGSGAR